MARLLLDENIHPILESQLRQAGHDIVTARERGLAGAGDDDVLHDAVTEERILITADKDFGRILEFGPLSGLGRVFLLRYHILDWNRMAMELTATLSRVERDYREDSRLLVVLSEGAFRLRHAPRS